MDETSRLLRVHTLATIQERLWDAMHGASVPIQQHGERCATFHAGIYSEAIENTEGSVYEARLTHTRNLRMLLLSLPFITTVDERTETLSRAVQTCEALRVVEANNAPSE